REGDDLGAVESEDADAKVAPARRERGVSAGDTGGWGGQHVIQSTDTVPLVCHRTGGLASRRDSPWAGCPVASSFGACAVGAGRCSWSGGRPTARVPFSSGSRRAQRCA